MCCQWHTSSSLPSQMGYLDIYPPLQASPGCCHPLAVVRVEGCCHLPQSGLPICMLCVAATDIRHGISRGKCWTAKCWEEKVKDLSQQPCLPCPSERGSDCSAPAHRAAELLLDPTFFCPGMCAGRTGCTPRSCALNGDEVTSSWQHVQISWSRSNLMQADVSRVLASSAGCTPPMCLRDLWWL